MSAGISARLLGALRRRVEQRCRMRSRSPTPRKDHYRRSAALYQLSVLDLYLKQGRQGLRRKRRESFAEAKLAGSAFGMAKAKMAESATLAVPRTSRSRSSTTMQESLAIARAAKSDVAECYALINLADIYLRAAGLQGRACDLSAALARARAGNRTTTSTHRRQQGQHGIRAVRLGPHRRRQATGRGGGGRVRARGRGRGNRRVCSAITGSTWPAPGDFKGALALRRPASSKLRRQDRARRPARKGRARNAEQVRIREAHTRNRAPQPRDEACSRSSCRTASWQQRDLVAAGRGLRGVVRRRGLPVPQAADDQPPARAARTAN